ncbi:hypothetical protein [Burkholderia stabilis]|uniref:hypothetical protein n=1 Tax=Burkholderia stabilis TaxID=95485 RepID=UPI00158F3549|nr:hypothetical protein [Burkholderia stabilis]
MHAITDLKVATCPGLPCIRRDEEREDAGLLRFRPATDGGDRATASHWQKSRITYCDESRRVSRERSTSNPIGENGDGMPHLIIETTESSSQVVAHDALAKTLHLVARSIDLFPPDAIRTRLHVAHRAVIGNGDEDAISVHVIVRIARGWTTVARRNACERLAGALHHLFDRASEERPVALSVEIAELDPEIRVQWHNLRERAACRSGTALDV